MANSSILNNSVINAGGSPAILSGALANRPAQGYDGLIYVANDAGNEAIYQYSAATSSWVNLTTGGGGGVGTLQQVTTLGNVTNLDMILDGNGGGEHKLTGNGIDDRAVNIAVNDTDDSGFVTLRNKDANFVRLLQLTADVAGNTDVNFKVTANANETVAYESLIASGDYKPTFANNLNCTVGAGTNCIFSRCGNIVSVSGGLQVTPSGAGVLCQADVSLPLTQQPDPFTASTEGAGLINSLLLGAAGGMFARTGDVVAVFRFLSVNAAAAQYYFTFSYRLV